MPKQLLLPKWQLYTKKEGRNLLFQSHFPDSNRGPTHYECVALPTEPKWQSLFKKRSGYFRSKANAKVRQISNVAKYFLQKAEKIYFFRV